MSRIDESFNRAALMKMKSRQRRRCSFHSECIVKNRSYEWRVKEWIAFGILNFISGEKWTVWNLQFGLEKPKEI